MAGWPAVAHFVSIRVPLRIELGPRNACAHDSRPARVGESVWEWSSTVDVVDGMAWHDGSGCAGAWACFASRGAFKQGAPSWAWWAGVECLVAQRSGSVTVA